MEDIKPRLTWMALEFWGVPAQIPHGMGWNGSVKIHWKMLHLQYTSIPHSIEGTTTDDVLVGVYIYIYLCDVHIVANELWLHMYMCTY